MILHIYIVLSYFASFTGYEDDIFEVIPNLHFRRTKHGGKFDKFGSKSLKKNLLRRVYEIFFFFSLGLVLLNIVVSN